MQCKKSTSFSNFIIAYLLRKSKKVANNLTYFVLILSMVFSYDILNKINKGGNIVLDLFLIIILIISLAKPDILLAKKVKEKASDEQKQILVKNYRKIYAIVIALFESLAIMRYSTIIGLVLVVIFFILFFTISWPATKQNKQILKELGM